MPQLQYIKKGKQMKSKVLNISNSDKILYLGLNLFSNEGVLESFLERNNLQQRDSLNDKEAKRICKYASYYGLIAEIKKKFK